MALETEQPQNHFTISELSTRYNLTSRTLRFYETKKLISPKRIGSKRLYTKRDNVRLALIIQGKNVGFSLDEIKEMLDLYDMRDGKKKQLKVSSAKFREQIEKLKNQRIQIDRAIEDLTNLCDEVDNIMEGNELQQNLVKLIFDQAPHNT